MTAIVGVLCEDGVVIGTDGSATFVYGKRTPTVEQSTEKIDIIDDCIILAGTGPGGLGQRFCELVRKAAKQRAHEKNSPIEFAKMLTHKAIKDLEETLLKPGEYGALLAFPHDKQAHLCEFAVSDLQPEFKTTRLWYSSMGAGQIITDPFLGFIRDIFWKGGPPKVYGAIFAITWILQHAIDVNPGGINEPMAIAVLQPDDDGEFKAEILDGPTLGQFRQNVKDAKDYLADYPGSFQPEAADKLPEIPES